jgi:hypothetical protein
LVVSPPSATAGSQSVLEVGLCPQSGPLTSFPERHPTSRAVALDVREAFSNKLFDGGVKRIHRREYSLETVPRSC